MKVTATHQPFPVESQFTCFELQAPTLDCPYHSHPEYEIIHILSGYGRRFIGNSVDTFEPGDLILLGSNVPHMYYTDPQESLSPQWARARILHFHESTLREKQRTAALSELLAVSGRGLRFHGAVRKQALALLKQLVDTQGISDDTLFYELLDTLASTNDCRILSPQTDNIYLHDAETAHQFNQACLFINKNFATNMPQSVVANKLNMSPSTFSRFFKTIAGKPFIQFINDIRIEHACRLLRETDLSIMAVGKACGFCNLSNFNRRFKHKTQRTPLKYRQHYILNGIWEKYEVN